MAQSILKYGFSAGELSPNMYGRLDLDKYALGAELIRNFYVDYRGGVSNRPGTKFIDYAASDLEDNVRLIPFVFSQEEGYLLEFTPLQIRVFYLGVLIDTIVSPWDGNEIWDLKYTQSADVMTIDHPDYMPYDLRRTTLITFELVEQTFGPSIDTPTNLTASANVAGNMQYAYCVTAIDANGQESLQTVPVVVSSVPLDPTSDSPKTVALEWTGVAGAVAYNIYKVGPVPNTRVISSLMGYIGQTTITKFTDTNIAPDFSRTPPIFRDPFAGGQITSITVTVGGAGFDTFTPCTLGDGDDGHGYIIADDSGAAVGVVILNPGKNNTVASVSHSGPGGGATFTGTVDENHYKPATVSYFQQRRVHGGSYAAPELLELSQISAYVNFDYSAALLDSDAITVSVASREVNTIKHFVPMSTGLVVLTEGGAFLVTGGQGEGSPVTPTSISALPQAATGAGDLPPIVVNYNIIFQQAMGSIVRDMAFSFQTQSYYGADRSMLANHLFNGYSLTDWAFAEEPHKLLWACRNDGKALTMTYVPDQEVFAWARHDTNGLFKSVASVPEGHINAVYFVVRRFVEGEWRNYIERLMSEPFDCVQDCWFLDSAVKYSGSEGSTTLTITYNGEDVVDIEGFTFLVDNIQPPDLNNSRSAATGGLGSVKYNAMAIDWERRLLLTTNVTNSLRTWNLDTLAIIGTSNVGGSTQCPAIGPSSGNFFFVRQRTVYRVDPSTMTVSGTVTLGDILWFGNYGPYAVASANTPDGVKEYIAAVDDGEVLRIGNVTDMTNTGFSISADANGTIFYTIAAPEENGEAVIYLVNGRSSTASTTGIRVRKFNIAHGLSGDDVTNTLLENLVPSAAGLTHFNGLQAAALDQEDNNLIMSVRVGPAPAWSGATTYNLNEVVSSGGRLYRSVQGGNLNNAVNLTTWWEDIGENPSTTQSYLVKYDPVTGDVSWAVLLGEGSTQARMFCQSRIRYGMVGIQISVGSSNFKTTIVNAQTGAIINTSTNFNFNFEEQAYDDYFGDMFGAGDSASNDPPSLGLSSSWSDAFMRFEFGGSPVVPETILVNCGVLHPTSYDADTGILQADVIHPFSGVLANDPEDTVVPIPAGSWSQGDPISEIEVAHLIGKTVGMVADGCVREEQVVPPSGIVPIDPPASWVIVGLPYQSQLRTLRLEAGELTVQGRRKLVSAVTARVSQTRGLKYGTSFDYDMYEFKDLQIEYNVPQQLLTQDCRIALDATWEEEGYICIQQDYPMPATVVGLIPEVVFGDNQR